jgi:hypothetical protein
MLGNTNIFDSPVFAPEELYVYRFSSPQKRALQRSAMYIPTHVAPNGAKPLSVAPEAINMQLLWSKDR